VLADDTVSNPSDRFYCHRIAQRQGWLSRAAYFAEVLATTVVNELGASHTICFFL
jgi:hypothetical protein